MWRFWGELVARVNNNNLEVVTLNDRCILFKETKEFISIKEDNVEANVIGNLAERMELDGKLSQLKISIGSCNMHNSQHLEDASTCTATTEASTYVSDAVDTSSESQ